MMPLMFAQVGEENIIKKIGGSPEVKQHLKNLGFVVGGTVKVVNALGGNVIVNVKESRVAISEADLRCKGYEIKQNTICERSLFKCSRGYQRILQPL